MRHLVIAIVALSGLAHAADSTGKVADIIKPSNLGAPVKWLDDKVGPAFKAEGDWAVYKVGGCDLTITKDGGAIIAYEVPAIPACGFDLTPFLASGAPTLDALTFGAVDANGIAKYTASCLGTNCGMHAPQLIHAFVLGGAPSNNINVKVTVVGSEEEPYFVEAGSEAAFAWQAVMEKAEGADYVLQTKFNCEGKYDTVARALFREVKISTIQVGFMKAPQPDNACP